MFSADPIIDLIHHEMEQERYISRLPVCSVCGEHIQDESALLIWDEWICDSCILANRAQVDDYLIDEEEMKAARWEE